MRARSLTGTLHRRAHGSVHVRVGCANSHRSTSESPSDLKYALESPKAGELCPASMIARSGQKGIRDRQALGSWSGADRIGMPDRIWDLVLLGLVPETQTSPRQAYAMHDALEARVRTERIETRPQQDTRVKSFLIAFFEPIHRLVHISQ
jgi:hypothetical protein